MEILLLQDVPGIGKKNDLLVVGDGFALNYLLPKRQALVATPTVRKRYAEQIRRRAEEKQRELAQKASAAGKLTGKKLRFTRKATKNGKLYAALSEKVIAEAIRDQLSTDVNEESVSIEEPIKALGMHVVSVTVGDVTQDLPVEVTVEQ